MFGLGLGSLPINLGLARSIKFKIEARAKAGWAQFRLGLVRSMNTPQWHSDMNERGTSPEASMVPTNFTRVIIPIIWKKLLYLTILGLRRKLFLCTPHMFRLLKWKIFPSHPHFLALSIPSQNI